MPAYLEHHDGTSWGHPAMISSLGSSSTTATLQKFFSKADANSDSSLSKDELLSALEGTSVSSDSDKLSSAVDSLVGSLDSDKNGSLSATEFSSFSSQFDYGSGSALLAAQEGGSTRRGAAAVRSAGCWRRGCAVRSVTWKAQGVCPASWPCADALLPEIRFREVSFTMCRGYIVCHRLHRSAAVRGLR